MLQEPVKPVRSSKERKRVKDERNQVAPLVLDLRLEVHQLRYAARMVLEDLAAEDAEGLWNISVPALTQLLEGKQLG